jgi:uncharacterized membrane protein
MAVDGVMPWLRRTFTAGFFITVPLVVSVVALIWLVEFADAVTSGLSHRISALAGLAPERRLPYVGILVTADELADIGIGFNLFEMGALAALTRQVVAEEQARRRPVAVAIHVADGDGAPGDEGAVRVGADDALPSAALGLVAAAVA